MKDPNPPGNHSAVYDPVVSVAAESTTPLVGIVELAEDRVAFEEIRGFLTDENVEVLSTRVPMPASLTLAGFAAIGQSFHQGAKSLPVRCDVAVVACASASLAIGPARLKEIIAEARPAAHIVEPIGAYERSLAARSVRRIALVTPYAAETHVALAGMLEEQGLNVASGLRLRLPEGRALSDVAAVSLLEALREASFGDVDAVLISCTALGTARLLTTLETHLGVPVLSTNLALSESTAGLLRPANASRLPITRLER